MSFPAMKAYDSGDFYFDTTIKEIDRAFVSGMKSPVMMRAAGTDNRVEINMTDKFIII